MTTDAERREATDAWTIQTREQQLRDLRAQLATATAERDDYRSKFRAMEDALHLERAQVITATQRAEAAEAEVTEQSWEIARLRYYTESLERRLSAVQRSEAATEASAALALHNPPASIQPQG